MKYPFLKRLASGPVLADGAMGTQLYARGISFSHCFDESNISNSEIISEIHRDYIASGSELIETNSFGDNYLRLAAYFDYEIECPANKVEAGAGYVFTQPLYDPEDAEKIARATEQFKTPVLCGILPLHSYRHAEFLHNEGPGIFVPDDIRMKLKPARDQASDVGIQVSRELLNNVSGMFAGAYPMPSFGRYEIVISVLEGVIKPKISDSNHK